MAGDERYLLVVSDDERLGMELGFTLPPKMSLRAVADAREAWRAMAERTPDVVCVEIRSGSAGGFALARDMAHKASYRNIPILMLLEREQDRWLADQAGAAAVLVQPVSPPNVMRAIDEVLGAPAPVA